MDGVSAGTICFHPKLTTGARRESKLIDGQRSMAGSTGAATAALSSFLSLIQTKISPVRISHLAGLLALSAAEILGATPTAQIC
jgi:hypothetical protein